MSSQALTISRPNFGLIGHRGVAGHAPENTFAGFKMAADMGLNWIEFDIRLAKNGELVIFHDPTLNRTTNGEGLLLEQDLETLRKLDAGKWFAPNFEGEKIPTLADTLPYLRSLNLQANLEVKCPADATAETIELFAKNMSRILDDFYLSISNFPLVSSFNKQFLFKYRELNPLAPVGFLVDIVNKDNINLVKETPNCTLHCGKRHLTPARRKAITNASIPLLVYTVNEPTRGISFLEAGAFAIFTDVPDLYPKVN